MSMYIRMKSKVTQKQPLGSTKDLTVFIHVEPSDTISKVKDALAKILNVGPVNLKIYLPGDEKDSKEAAEMATVSDLRIADESEVNFKIID
jgi:hypothetical protein